MQIHTFLKLGQSIPLCSSESFITAQSVRSHYVQSTSIMNLLWKKGKDDCLYPSGDAKLAEKNKTKSHIKDINGLTKTLKYKLIH